MTDPESKPSPLACTLEPRELTSRLTRIAALNARFLRNHRRDDLRLELHYCDGARDQLLQIVHAEQACCAFLTFEVRDEPGGVCVIIQAPEAARVKADTAFEAFLRKMPAQ